MDKNNSEEEKQLVSLTSKSLLQLSVLLSDLRERVAEKADLNDMDFRVLYLLKDSSPISMTNFIALTAIDRSNLGSIVARLVKNKYVLRLRYEGDRRVVMISVSTKGKQVLAQFEAIMDQVSYYIWEMSPDVPVFQTFLDQLTHLGEMPFPGSSTTLS